MFGDMNFWQLMMKGGIVTVLLIALSVISWWIIIDRLIRFTKIKNNTKEFMEKLKNLIVKDDEVGAMTLCETTPGPVSEVVREGLRHRKKDKAKIESAMQRALNSESERMQFSLGILGSIGNVAPFVGLFGTVLGIMRAFKDIAMASGAGPSVVANGIAEALVTTAFGLVVAVPAVIAYNYFMRFVDSVETEAVNASSELIDILDEVK
ncbi:MAG: MotA/TolQ/ExbB proton channel family protein [bacterium]